MDVHDIACRVRHFNSSTFTLSSIRQSRGSNADSPALSRKKDEKEAFTQRTVTLLIDNSEINEEYICKTIGYKFLQQTIVSNWIENFQNITKYHTYVFCFLRLIFNRNCWIMYWRPCGKLYICLQRIILNYVVNPTGNSTIIFLKIGTTLAIL